MNTKKNRIGSFIGGIVLGMIVGAILMNFYMCKKILNQIDICSHKDCVCYQPTPNLKK